MKNNRGENIFTRINTKKLRTRAFNLAVESKVWAMLKIGGELRKCKCLDRTGAEIYVRPTQNLTVKNGTKCVLMFNVGVEKYFLNSEIRSCADGDFALSLDVPLFKLQRRSNFRVEPPDSWNCSVTLLKRNNESLDETFRVNDISAGGLSFMTDMNHPLKAIQNDQVEGFFNFEGKLKAHFEGKIKNSLSMGSRGSGVFRIGIEFDSLDDKIIIQLTEILMEIQRILLAESSS
ncbi:MAG: flagellar brake protein [Bdellovibrionales bacterium]